MRIRRFELVPGVVVRVTLENDNRASITWENNGYRHVMYDPKRIKALFPDTEESIEKAKEVGNE